MVALRVQRLVAALPDRQLIVALPGQQGVVVLLHELHAVALSSGRLVAAFLRDSWLLSFHVDN